MYQTCPKCAYRRQPQDAAPEGECPGCGLIFRKYVQQRAAQGQEGALPQAGAAGGAAAEPAPVAASRGAADAPAWRERLEAWFLHVDDEVPAWRCYANAGLFALSIWLGLRWFMLDLASAEMMATVAHLVMVPFHEVGHLVFMPFGELLTLLGGSLAQLLIPAAFMAYFSIWQRDTYTGSLMLWWAGTQFLSIAPYMYDAKTPTLVLLTARTGDDGAHDFVDALGILGLLNRAHEVAWVTHKLGLLVMLAAWAWGGYILWRQFENKEKS